MDSKPGWVDVVQEVEEPAEGLAGRDHRWIQPVASPTGMGQDEQMAIGDQERSVFRQALRWCRDRSSFSCMNS